MLEPCAVKVASTVLRGLGAGNSPRLPDSSVFHYFFQSQDMVEVNSIEFCFFFSKLEVNNKYCDRMEISDYGDVLW